MLWYNQCRLLAWLQAGHLAQILRRIIEDSTMASRKINAHMCAMQWLAGAQVCGTSEITKLAGWPRPTSLLARSGDFDGRPPLQELSPTCPFHRPGDDVSNADGDRY